MKFESAFCLTNESRAESIFASKLLKTIFKVYWTCTMYIAQGSRHASELVTTKGQLILKCLFGIFNSPKKRKKKFDFLWYLSTTGPIVFVCFLGELKTPKGHFEIN